MNQIHRRILSFWNLSFQKKKNRRDKWEVKKKSKQNELQRWRCRPCLCNENYGLCCQNEAFIEKKSGKETRGWGVGLWKEIKKKPIQIYCKNSFCRIMNISESIWVWIQQRLRYFSFFGVYIHLFYFKQWIGFFLNFLYVSLKKRKKDWNRCWWWIFIICKTSSFHLIVFSFSVFISFSPTIIYFWWRLERFEYFKRLKFFSISLQIKLIWFDEHAWRIRNMRKNTFFPNFSKKYFIEIHVKFEKNSRRMQNSS